MPAKSKAQYRFMKAVESGAVDASGLSKEDAREFTQTVSKKRFSKLKERLGKKK